MQQISILLPVLTLAFWTFIIFAIMAPARFYFLRIKHPQTAAHTKDLKGLLPPWTERVADNYNHLMEQPTIFYALCFYLALAGQVDALQVQLAWAYVALRVLHSLIQITSNNVMARFSFFSLSTIAMLVMVVREALQLMQ